MKVWLNGVEEPITLLSASPSQGYDDHLCMLENEYERLSASASISFILLGYVELFTIKQKTEQERGAKTLIDWIIEKYGATSTCLRVGQAGPRKFLIGFSSHQDAIQFKLSYL